MSRAGRSFVLLGLCLLPACAESVTPASSGHFPNGTPWSASALFDVKAVERPPMPSSILPGVRTAWKLEFHDEFDGTAIDQAKWSPFIGPLGEQTNIGNSEEECYLPSNFAFGDGLTHLVARRENVACAKPAFAAKYTSGALVSSGKFALAHGYFELRAKVPKGKGLWPAFWLMPDSREWPPEIDVFEFINEDTTTIHQTYHFKDGQGVHQLEAGHTDMVDASEDFHVYGLSKRPGVLRWYVDGRMTKEVTHDVFDGPVYLLLNLAVGGSWPGSPDPSTPFPSAMTLDFVRAYSCLDWSQCG